MSDLQHRLETGPWKWEIYQATHPWPVLAAGEAETYEAVYAVMRIMGLKRVKEGKKLKWHYEGKKVFLKFERVTDGFSMQDWGTEEE